MIPIEVEYRIAVFFFHNYLPKDIMMQVEEALIHPCLEAEKEEDLDHDELVWMAIDMIKGQLEGKSLK